MNHLEKTTNIDIVFLSKYYLSIMPKYSFKIVYNKSFIIYFNAKYINEFFFVLHKHINFQFKMFIDLVTLDFIGYNHRFSNIYNLLSIQYNSRLYCKTLIPKNLQIQSLSNLYLNII